MKRLLCITLLLALAQMANAKEGKIDYCDEKLCPPGSKLPHIACNHNETYHKRCGATAAVFPMDKAMQNFILRQHNTYRNQVARGGLHSLPVAARMLTLTWDYELANISTVAVRLCTIVKIDSCISSTLFSTPGQNSVYNKYKGEQDPLKVMRSQLKSWFEQYRYADVASLITGTSSGKQEIGHFLQMMVGLANKMGCAIIEFVDDGWEKFLTICIYSCSKVPCQPVYIFGNHPAERCNCGSSLKYKNLCTENEIVKDCNKHPECGNSVPHDNDYRMDHGAHDNDYSKEAEPHRGKSSLFENVMQFAANIRSGRSSNHKSESRQRSGCRG